MTLRSCQRISPALSELKAVLEATKVRLGVNSIISPPNVYHLQNLPKRLDNPPLNKTGLKIEESESSLFVLLYYGLSRYLPFERR
jgi:hypothetical protein